jgi:hypothetical protein
VEISTSYLYSTTAAYEIKEYNPDAKIVIILRNPSERAFSNFKYKLKTGKEESLSFAEALVRERSRIREGAPYGFHYLNMGFYYSQVKRYIDVFDRNKILILLFDELKSSPQTFYQRISEFFNIDNLISFKTEKKYNKSGEIRSRFIMNFLNNDHFIKRLAKIAIPKDKRRHVSGFLKDVNISSKKMPMDAHMREKLNTVFKEDLLKLEVLTDIDLTSWYSESSNIISD